MRHHNFGRTAVAAVAASLVWLSACTGGDPGESGDDGGGGMIPQLTFPSEAQGAAGGLANYNPYSPTKLTEKWLFESLLIRNGLTCGITPWLASGHKWEGPNKLRFTIRDGVKWSDGEPFTAKDVAFTFNLAKQYPAIDKAGLWNDSFGAPASAVTAEGDTVVVDFTGKAGGKFDSIISLPILPEHVYSKVGDPAKYVDKTPVNTGPFKIGSYNGRRLVLERRADYWQADQVKVKKLVLEGQYDAAQAALKLRSGQLDAFIPNPDRTFVSADPDKNKFWYPPNGMVALTMNLERPPFNDVKFREATAYAMDKEEMSKKATYGIMKPASQSGLKLPYAEKWLPSRYSAADTMIPYDPAKAGRLLDAAGYQKGPDGKRTNPDGSPINLTFSVHAGFIDTAALADVVVRGLNAVGVNTKIVAIAPESVDAQKKSGDFDMMFEYMHGGCEMARNFGAVLHSSQIPTKNEIRSNVQRWRDPATDAIVDKLTGTIDEAEQKALVGELVDTMMTKFPVMLLIEAPARIIHRTDKAVGWPSAKDPYAQPVDDRLLILTHLRAAK